MRLFKFFAFCVSILLSLSTAAQTLFVAGQGQAMIVNGEVRVFSQESIGTGVFVSPEVKKLKDGDFFALQAYDNPRLVLPLQGVESWEIVSLLSYVSKKKHTEGVVYDPDKRTVSLVAINLEKNVKNHFFAYPLFLAAGAFFMFLGMFFLKKGNDIFYPMSASTFFLVAGGVCVFSLLFSIGNPFGTASRICTLFAFILSISMALLINRENQKNVSWRRFSKAFYFFTVMAAITTYWSLIEKTVA